MASVLVLNAGNYQNGNILTTHERVAFMYRLLKYTAYDMGLIK